MLINGEFFTLTLKGKVRYPGMLLLTGDWNYHKTLKSYLRRLKTSSSVNRVIARPGLPARPVRPINTHYIYRYIMYAHNTQNK